MLIKKLSAEVALPTDKFDSNFCNKFIYPNNFIGKINLKELKSDIKYDITNLTDKIFLKNSANYVFNKISALTFVYLSITFDLLRCNRKINDCITRISEIFFIIGIYCCFGFK